MMNYSASEVLTKRLKKCAICPEEEKILPVDSIDIFVCVSIVRTMKLIFALVVEPIFATASYQHLSFVQLTI